MMKNVHKRRNRNLFPALMILTLLFCLPKVLPVLGTNAKGPTDGVSAVGQPQPKPPQEMPQEMPQEPPPREEPTAEPPPVPETDPVTLFIGDSRTVGLQEYAGLKDAVFFCTVGLNVYQLFSTTVYLPDRDNVNLETLLTEQTFDRIHLMLGINELGYDFDATIQTYQSAVDKIRSLQPNAVLYLGANLHVSQARSGTDRLYNNTNINRFNQAVARMADGEEIVYVDVNPLFDEGSALADSNTGDGVHVYGACYEIWGRWLYETMENEGPN